MDPNAYAATICLIYLNYALFCFEILEQNNEHVCSNPQNAFVEWKLCMFQIPESVFYSFSEECAFDLLLSGSLMSLFAHVDA